MSVNQWSSTTSTTSTANTALPSAESIVARVLPGQLSTPAGWHSEILQSQESASVSATNNLATTIDTNTFENYDEYKTLSTSDAPPMIFSSANEASSTTVTNINTVNEYCDTSSAQEQQSATINSATFQQPPVVLHKTLPNNTVTYQQNVSVKYLQPPTPPPPGPIIIREVRPPPPPPQSPVQIRQRPPPPTTPPPIVIREKPPVLPPRLPSQVVEKVLPPPPRPPRRMIVERFGLCPPKPPDVVIERWLPYKRSERRKVLFERAPAAYLPPREPNTLILHDSPHARVHKEFINQGVVHADPISYLQRYGAEIDSWHLKSDYAHLIHEADRAVPPPHPSASLRDFHSSYPHPSSPVGHVWDRMRAASPPPYPSYNQHDYYSRYSNSSPVNYGGPSPYYGNGRTMVDVTSSWNRHCSSPPSFLPSYDFSSPSSAAAHPRTIQVNSEGELQHVLSDLTNERAPPPSSYRSY